MIFEISESGLAPSLQWELLQSHLKLHYNYELPLFDSINLLENIQALLKIRSVPLIKENKTLFDPSRADYIFTPSELFWNMEKVGVPFTRTAEKVTTDFSKIQEIFGQYPDSEVLFKNFARLTPPRSKSTALLSFER
ncbi:hypothetical protein PHSC3_002025 [Chlamydiales bacterium STE3]|nr:hypothetical protein PHSC3_002025 [Chlamydiales bacterium STE3]